MKKIIVMLFLSMVVCAVFAQNNVGGNVNSKESISYADRNFLSGILNYDSLKSKPAPYNWPELMDNTFKFTYVTGECRMILSQFLFDAAEKLGIEKEFTYDCEFHDGKKPYAKLSAIFIQKVQGEVYYRAFYKAEDIIPTEVKNSNLPTWIYNKDPVSIFQKIYFKDGSSVTVYHSTYSIQEHNEEPESYFFKFKLYGNFDIMDSTHFAFTNFVFKDFESKVYSSETALFIRPNRKFNLIAYFDFVTFYELYSKDDENFTYYFSCYGRPLIENDYSRYSLINMFDRNPETSYVEDESDDNINFSFYFNNRQKQISKISIINGYAQSDSLYIKNNRVKTLSITTRENQTASFELNEIMSPQVFNLNLSSMGFSIKSTELYKGTKYNDTCIAEFNILTDEGWLISGKQIIEVYQNYT